MILTYVHVLLIVGAVNSIVLPSYFHKCKLNDPNINDCILKSANEAIPLVVKGIKELNAPQLNPLHIKSVEVDAGKNLKLVLKDIDILGLETTKMTSCDVHFDEHRCNTKFHFDYLSIKGTYEIDGKILVLAIKGNGPINASMVEVEADTDMTWELINRDGSDYVHMKTLLPKFTATRIYFDMQNLFNGDKMLGDEMNKFLNENWRELQKDFEPSIAKTIGLVSMKILNSLTKKVSFDEIFPK